MYSQELEELIEAILADGEISPKERNILHRRAMSEGIDPDEIDVVVEGRLIKKLSQTSSNSINQNNDTSNVTNKINKQRETKKCPACGALRTSFAAICPDCGYEFRDTQKSDVLQNFIKSIEEYDRMILSEEPKKNSVFWPVMGWIFLFPFMFAFFVFKRIKAKHTPLDGTEKLKSEAIINYNVPNSRADLIEFALLLENKVKTINYFNALTDSGMQIQKWNEIWNTKANHIVQKAQLALQEDKLSLNKINTSVQNITAVMKRNALIQWIMMGVLCALFIVMIILMS